MSEAGFHWEGFARALQGDAMLLLGGLVLLVVVSLLINRAFNLSAERQGVTADKVKEMRWWKRKIITVLIVLAIVSFGWRITTFALANRIPRADVDKSGVYEKMDSNIKPPSGRR